MKKLMHLGLLILFCTLRVMAQGTFVYTNNDRTPNTLSAFSAAVDGSLSPVPGSPFTTGGNGGGFRRESHHDCRGEELLYAGTAAATMSALFRSTPFTGVLTSVPGSPFATGGVADSFGMSLTATPDDKFLVVANGASRTISVFSVAANGSLSPVRISIFKRSQWTINQRQGDFGRKISGCILGGQIFMFNISATGALMAVPDHQHRTQERPVLIATAQARSFCGPWRRYEFPGRCF